MTEAYPLHWPPGKPRTARPARSKFQTAPAAAVRFLMAEIRRLGGTQPVVSTNVPLRKDGLPYAAARPPDDPGVAVYFRHKGRAMCFACDRWDRVHDNAYAVGKTIEALRGIERWGTGAMVEQAFAGFAALPAPSDPHAVLGVRPGATAEEVDAAYRRRAKAAHPDAGGSVEAMRALNAARQTLTGRG